MKPIRLHNILHIILSLCKKKKKGNIHVCVCGATGHFWKDIWTIVNKLFLLGNYESSGMDFNLPFFILFGCLLKKKKKMKTDRRRFGFHVHWPWGYYIREISQRKTNTVWYHLHMESRRAELTEGNRRMVTRVGVWGKMGRYWSKKYILSTVRWVSSEDLMYSFVYYYITHCCCCCC